MTIIIDHNHPENVRLRKMIGKHKWNGAHYYSCEIAKYFIPTIKTDRNWVTVRAVDNCLQQDKDFQGCVDHSIVFVHDIFHFEERYAYTFPYDDIVYVVSMPWNVEQAEKHGKAIYLPLSIDVAYVEQFKRDKKDKDTAFVGRDEWRKGYGKGGSIKFPKGTDFVEMLPREQLLSQMSRYENVYAVCRTALEAKVLGCNVLPYHKDFPDPEFWQVLDSRDAAKMLQAELDRIDGK